MKTCLAIVALLVSLFVTSTAWPRNASTTINISARVEKFAEWAQDNSIILESDFSGPINNINQDRTITRTIVLYSNADTIIAAKPGLNGGILTRGADTLKTSYRIASGVEHPDPAFKDAAQFLAPQNTYTVLHQPGIGRYEITLELQATSPPNTAPEEGTYTCSIILTATW